MRNNDNDEDAESLERYLLKGYIRRSNPFRQWGEGSED